MKDHIELPEHVPSYSLPVVFTSLLVGALWITHLVLREVFLQEPGHPVRVSTTVALIVAFGLFLWAELRVIQRFDEFHRQVHFYALAFAFPASMLAMFAIGFLRAEGWFAGSDPRDLGGVMMLLYAVGLGLAWRRYR